jgi:hypothetical protein
MVPSVTSLGDHLANDFIVRAVGVELIAEPTPKPVASKDQDLPLVRTDKEPRKSSRKVVGVTSIREHPFGPAPDAIRLIVRLKQSNLFE